MCSTYGTDAFFYLDQARFIAEINVFYVNPASTLRLDATFVCLAHAAFALGSQWASLVMPEDTSPELSPQDGDPGRIFYQQALGLIPDIIEHNSLSAIQAVFVVGVYLLPASAISSSYVYLGLGLRKALALHLHLESDELDISDVERELRRRVWWAIYSLERFAFVFQFFDFSSS